jgi:predicted DNA-binding protein YlxM (UPF0122 family)
LTAVQEKSGGVALKDQVLDILPSVLLEIYGGLLTEKQREALEMHLNLDYSLSEIAENQGISRQAALDSIKRGIVHLNELESKLKLYGRFSRSMQVYAEMEEIIEMGGNEQALLQAVQKARSIWEEL